MLTQIVLLEVVGKLKVNYPQCCDCKKDDPWECVSEDEERATVVLKCKYCRAEHMFYI